MRYQGRLSPESIPQACSKDWIASTGLPILSQDAPPGLVPDMPFGGIQADSPGQYALSASSFRPREWRTSPWVCRAPRTVGVQFEHVREGFQGRFAGPALLLDEGLVRPAQRGSRVRWRRIAWRGLRLL